MIKIYEYWQFLCVILVVVPSSSGQEKIDLLAEKNEIPHEPDQKLIKSSSKPVLVIKEGHDESKTTPANIKTQALEALNNRTTIATSTTEAPFTLRPWPDYICPPKDSPKPFLSLPCFATVNCGFLGKDMLCCDGRCLKGVKPTKTDPIHDPIFFGIIQPKCPKDPLTELSEVKECFTDDECSPRICCGETLPSGERVRYCRTPIPVWEKLPLPSPVLEPLKIMTSYMQCTPPPPAHLDLHPKACQNPMDCFPNLCCQEKGRKFCRPPKKSLLALVADLGQRIIPEDAARKFIERIS
ncbi:uncharacterized protein LOC126750520 [Anthonomus grandis grandis]|uniref:uncharacterized protein LOC126750520 n=1 Tax=Anthonomus grandis grandis TaxID=2921223 RepID=UPI002165DCD4|nr:uncharacterized protein LOC126750520 [Anthonomus grandis grandis]